MNIFVLDYSPTTAARYHNDKHVVKMILESAQIMCTVAEKLGYEAPYRRTHANHPCTLWAAQSKQNYLWLKDLARALNDEYCYRFGHDTNHKSWDVITSLPHAVADSLPDAELTPFALAMPDHYKVQDDFGVSDAVASYRNYYIGDKKYFSNKLAKYTLRKRPVWLDDEAENLRIAELKLRALA